MFIFDLLRAIVVSSACAFLSGHTEKGTYTYNFNGNPSSQGEFVFYFLRFKTKMEFQFRRRTIENIKSFELILGRQKIDLKNNEK